MLRERLELPDRLHTLGDYPQAEAVRHGKDGTDDRPVRFARFQVSHEAAVDLDGVERQLFETTQARISGPEIIDLDGDAQVSIAVGIVSGAHWLVQALAARFAKQPATPAA